MDNPKVYIGDTEVYGWAVFARDDIYAGEVIAHFDGEILETEGSAMQLPRHGPVFFGQHAIQIGRHKWQDGPLDGVARCIAHSCEPNCGIKNLNEVVAMRYIKKGDEITWDYETTEDSDFRMECKCGTPTCRGVVGAFSLMPQDVRERYRGYISEWLVKEYNLK